MRTGFSIKQTWYALMIAGGLLPLIIVSLIVAPKVYNFLLDDALLHSRAINSRIADSFNEEIKRHITLLENKSDPIAHIIGSASRSDVELIDILLMRVLIREEDINAIALIQRNGDLIAYADRNNDIAGQSNPEAWSWLSDKIHDKDSLIFPIEDKVYISPVLRNKYDSKHFHFLIMVHVGDVDQPAALLVVELAAQEILKNTMGRFSRPDYNTYFVSNEGEFLYPHSQKKYISGDLLTNIEIINSGLKTNSWDEKKVYRGMDRREVFGSSRLISLLDWRVISEVYKDDVLFPIYETIFTSYIVILVVVLIFIWAGVFIAGRIISPISALTKSFQQAARQDYSPSLIDSSLEEFQQLAKGYDAMVSEIKKRERKLQESKRALEEHEGHFRTVTDNIHEVLLIVSVYWEDVIYISPAYEDIWKFSRDSLYKSPISWIDNVHPLDRETVNMGISGLNNEAFQFPEYRIQLLSGEIRWALSKVYPVSDASGVVIRYVFIVRDITEKRQAQLEQKELHHQLQQSQKMEAIGQLTGGIAHDFNNILTAIMGYNSLALDRFGDEVDPKLVEYLSEVDLAGERARDLISQLLVFSRESTGNSEPVIFAPLIKEVTRMLQTSFPSGIDIRHEMQSDIPKVLMDPIRLHQLIMNLCINARDAIGDNGSITIRLLFVSEYSGHCDGCYKSFQGDFVELIVEDTGYGIEPSVMNRIFDPFFTTKELGKGTGMGLSIIHGIMHDIDGHILVSSGPTGTAFRLFFPVIEKSVESIETGEEESGKIEDGQGQHILVVDDEISVAQFEAELLNHHGYQALVMTDSEKALAEFMDNPDKYDLVITDQSMPKMTGIELASAMLKQRPDLPVILCSGYLPELSHEEISAMGIREFQAKPVQSDSFRRMVQKLLS